MPRRPQAGERCSTARPSPSGSSSSGGPPQGQKVAQTCSSSWAARQHCCVPRRQERQLLSFRLAMLHHTHAEGDCLTAWNTLHSVQDTGMW